MEKELGDKLSCRKDTGEAGGEPVSSPSLPTHRGTCHQSVALKIPWNLAKTPSFSGQTILLLQRVDRTSQNSRGGTPVSRRTRDDPGVCSPGTFSTCNLRNLSDLTGRNGRLKDLPKTAPG